MDFSTDLKIGIVGGGQLGKMLIQAAKRMGLYVAVIDPTPDSPAGQIADRQIVSDFYDEESIKQLASSCDITTYEIEHINVEVLKELEQKGYKIYPSPYVLEIIQDKSKQKQMLTDNNIPTAKWQKVDGDLASALTSFGLPAVQKACKGGYDGRGVFVIHNADDIKNSLKCESFLEEQIDFEKELAAMVSRNSQGEIKCYPVVEMIFDTKANICDSTIAPARIDKKVQKQAIDIAVNCVEVLKGVGVFGIEMFVTKDGSVMVNEIAPRPHNSGHYTIEACITSQFEQHLRAIMNLPLGATDLIIPSVMVNILGAEGYEGKPIYEGLEDVLKIPGANVHIYGKKVTKPYRKMGHVTIVDSDIESAIEKGRHIKQVLKVISGGN